MEPIALAPNQPPGRFYRGGAAIAELRGSPLRGTHEPEDWIASVTCVTGEERLGRTRLPDGMLLQDAIRCDPEGWLGPDHVRAYGASPELLTKLLDAGERLPVHVHPSKEFAAAHLDAEHGKAEAWIYLTDGDAHIGFLPHVTAEDVLPLLEHGETEAVLSLMHHVEIVAGEVVYCPPGLPHAIGGGSFMVEVQEPADLSIFLEWKDYPLPGGAAGHLGLTPQTAATSVTAGVDRKTVEALVCAGPGMVGDLLAGTGAPFRAQRLRAGRRLEPGFAVVVTTSGRGSLMNADGRAFALERGTVAVVPHAWRATRVEGAAELDVIVAMPPRA